MSPSGSDLYLILMFFAPFVIAWIVGVIPRHVREDIWWSIVGLVICGAVISGAYTLLTGGQLFVAAPDYP
jgi:hypothetical protein